MKTLTIVRKNDLNNHLFRLETRNEIAIAVLGSAISLWTRKLHNRWNQMKAQQPSYIDHRRKLQEVCIVKSTLFGVRRYAEGWILQLESGAWTIQSVPIFFCWRAENKIYWKKFPAKNCYQVSRRQSPQTKLSIQRPEDQKSKPETKSWIKDNFELLGVKFGKAEKAIRGLDLIRGICRNRTKKLMDQKFIIKLDKSSDDESISPIVTRFKK